MLQRRGSEQQRRREAATARCAPCPPPSRMPPSSAPLRQPPLDEHLDASGEWHRAAASASLVAPTGREGTRGPVGEEGAMTLLLRPQLAQHFGERVGRKTSGEMLTLPPPLRPPGHSAG